MSPVKHGSLAANGVKHYAAGTNHTGVLKFQHFGHFVETPTSVASQLLGLEDLIQGVVNLIRHGSNSGRSP